MKKKYRVIADDGREFDVDAYNKAGAEAKVRIITHGRVGIFDVKEVL